MRWEAPVFSDAAAAIDLFDSAIVAVPHSEHRRVCEPLLDAGKHVLLEKPMAVTSADASRLVHAAEHSRGSLTIGYMRRQLQVNRWVRDIVASKQLGSVRTVHLEDGAPDAWDAATDSYLSRASAGGGVLIGVGVHSLDMLTWWLGDLAVVTYRDDSLGGLEAEAELALEARSGVEITLLLSRLRTLSNTVVLEFERGALEVSLDLNRVCRSPSLPRHVRPRLQAQSFTDLFTSQLIRWFAQLDGGPREMPSAREAASIVALVEESYGMRGELRMPWDRRQPSVSSSGA
jgi:predicted dehydrogenase